MWFMIGLFLQHCTALYWTVLLAGKHNNVIPNLKTLYMCFLQAGVIQVTPGEKHENSCHKRVFCVIFLHIGENFIVPGRWQATLNSRYIRMRLPLWSALIPLLKQQKPYLFESSVKVPQVPCQLWRVIDRLWDSSSLSTTLNDAFSSHDAMWIAGWVSFAGWLAVYISHMYWMHAQMVINFVTLLVIWLLIVIDLLIVACMCWLLSWMLRLDQACLLHSVRCVPANARIIANSLLLNSIPLLHTYFIHSLLHIIL